MATVGYGILKNSGNLAGGHSLTSLFFLLSASFRSAWGRGERKTSAIAYARWILATESRSSFQMQRVEPRTYPVAVQL